MSIMPTEPKSMSAKSSPRPRFRSDGVERDEQRSRTIPAIRTWKKTLKRSLHDAVVPRRGS